MCIFKECPIFEKCEKELEQVLYCRHVEMIKRIAKMRRELKQKQAGAVPKPSVETNIRTVERPESEPSRLSH